MDEQGVKDIFVESLRHMAGCENRWIHARDFRIEADRLAPPPGAPGPDPFEGVKYVTWDVDGLQYGCLEPAVDGVHYAVGPDNGPATPVTKPNGAPRLVRTSVLTPWHPKKGDKVRLEKRPHLVGTITKLSRPKDPCDCYVEWRDGVDSWMSFNTLRPFSFAPPEPEPEKPEFKKGDLVKIAGAVGIALHLCNEWWVRCIAGGAVGPYDSPLFRRATDAEVASQLMTDTASEYAKALVPALRAHAQHIAKEAGE